MSVWIAKLLLIIAILFGHGAGWIACFNRINATGLSRITIKVIEKFFIGICLLLPFLFFALNHASFLEWIQSVDYQWPNPPMTWVLYGTFCLICLLMLTPGWIGGRFVLQRKSPNILRQIDRQWDLRPVSSEPLFMTPEGRRLGNLKFNEIGMLEVSEKHLYHPEMPIEWFNLRIGHISDIHLTGQMHRRYQQFAFDRLMELRPDVIILSGDIIDYDHQLDLLQTLLGPLHAPLGKYFVLGNHDRRLSEPKKIRELLAGCGWADLGGKSKRVIDSGRELHLIGNERPWFGKEPEWEVRQQRGPKDGISAIPELRIAVSHSPDQWPWAQRLQSHLMLAGHTHGGQVRLPWLGPIVAPSWFGSRYASGVFMEGNLLIHVSRGLSGVHLLRWRCLPEVTLLVASPVEHSKGLAANLDRWSGQSQWEPAVG